MWSPRWSACCPRAFPGHGALPHAPATTNGLSQLLLQARERGLRGAGNGERCVGLSEPHEANKRAMGAVTVKGGSKELRDMVTLLVSLEPEGVFRTVLSFL